MPSTWLSNGKVKFSMVIVNEKQYLVCTSIVGSISVKFVEDILTGKRVFPTLEENRSVDNIDDLVKLLISQL